MHTVKTFWTGKRFLKLFIFALLLGNVTLYCVGAIARRQVVNNAVNSHGKIYTAYLQAVERARRPQAVTSPPARPVDEAVGAEDAAPSPSGGSGDKTAGESAVVSPYWSALRDTRRQFPYYKMNVILHDSVEAERDGRIMDLLRERPRGWSVTDEQEGWARSFYVLPTRNTAAFQVVSYVRDDLNGWENTAIMIGFYAFVLLFAFGWFWTRALDDSAGGAGPEVRERVEAVGQALRQMEPVLHDLRIALAACERSVAAGGGEALRELDELAGQMRMISINGSIEAARSADSYRVFHAIMQEVNQIATRSRELLKGMQIAAPTADLESLRRKIDVLQGVLSATYADAAVAPRANHGEFGHRRAG